MVKEREDGVSGRGRGWSGEKNSDSHCRREAMAVKNINGWGNSQREQTVEMKKMSGDCT